jgi:hypothetical protein
VSPTTRAAFIHPVLSSDTRAPGVAASRPRLVCGRNAERRTCVRCRGRASRNHDRASSALTAGNDPAIVRGALLPRRLVAVLARAEGMPLPGSRGRFGAEVLIAECWRAAGVLLDQETVRIKAADVERRRPLGRGGRIRAVRPDAGAEEEQQKAACLGEEAASLVSVTAAGRGHRGTEANPGEPLSRADFEVRAGAPVVRSRATASGPSGTPGCAAWTFNATTPLPSPLPGVSQQFAVDRRDAAEHDDHATP